MDRFQGQLEHAVEAQPVARPDEVLELARVRRTELGLAYAGAVTPPAQMTVLDSRRSVPVWLSTVTPS